MNTREEINLRVLKQHDPSIDKILKQSPYVVLYSYSVDQGSWSKLPYEGTLFVYQTATGHCGYRILNRLNLDCFSRMLKAEEDVMETEGYVIHRCDEDIWGIWIWDSQDRSNIYAAMRDAAKMSEDSVGQGSGTLEEGGNQADGQPSSIKMESWTPSTITG